MHKYKLTFILFLLAALMTFENTVQAKHCTLVKLKIKENNRLIAIPYYPIRSDELEYIGTTDSLGC